MAAATETRGANLLENPTALLTASTTPMTTGSAVKSIADKSINN